MDNNTVSEAALRPLPPSTDDLTLDNDLQSLALSPQVSRELQSERSRPSDVDLTSPVLSVSPTKANEPEVNIYSNTLSPSASPTKPSRPASRSPSFRNLTLTRSRSPSPSPSFYSGHVSEAGPSRPSSTSSHRSVTAIHSPSPRRTPSPLHSPSGHSSPRPPHYLYSKPTLPSSTPVIVTDEDDSVQADDSAPFESIPLQTTPPPHPATLPSSPKTLHPGSPSRKRRSWNGFTVDKQADRRSSHEVPNGHLDPADPSSRSSISTLPSSRSPSDPRQTERASASDPASGSAVQETPRLHAPPAHPHPYPIPGPNSPPPTTKRLSQTQIHQPTAPALGVKGTSTFEKVISHTRPSWLPPKDRVEDETHYHQWEEMMAQARKHEEEKRKVDEARRIEREKRLAINTPKWEEMLDEKTFSADRIRKDPVLRQIWFDGAPTYLRGKAWSLAIGNPLALSKDNYKACVARSKKAIESGRFPADILERLDKDLDGTLVHLRLFQDTSPLRADLHELICAWVVYRSDTAQGYAPYITYLGALLLLSSPPSTAFLSLVNLLSRPVLRAFYTETKDEIDAFYRVFENLQADMFPKIFANCKNLGLKVPESWFRSLLVEQVPFEAACRLWDQIVLDGDGYIFRAALAIFGFLEPRLHFPDRDEIESVLEGRNRATAAILEREKERARLRGETFQDTPDGKLSVFGLNEQALFDWLKDDGWKEARFERLVIREMPD